MQINKKKKKILLIIKTPPPITGFTIMNKMILDNLQELKNDFEIDVISLNFDIKQENIIKKKLLQIIRFYISLIVIFKKIIKNKPNLVYFTISPVKRFLRDLVYVFIIKLLSVKLVYHLHGKGINDIVTKSKLKYFLYKYAYKNVDVILLSNSLKNDIKNIFDKSVYVLPNGIDDYNEFQSHQMDSDNTIKCIFLSNFIKSKGIFDALEAIKILKDEKYDIKLLVVGQEMDVKVKEIHDYICSENLDQNVIIMGSIYGEEKKKILNSADIFLLPTYYKTEAFPLVILEAMQAELPIITTNEGAIAEIVINNRTGYIVGKRNPSEIVEKLKILIMDKDLRLKMGRKAKQEYIDKYTKEKFISNLKRIFQNILGDEPC